MRAATSFVLVSIVLSSTQIARAADPPPLAFLHVNVVDCAAGRIRPDQTVIILNRLITAVDDSAKLPAPTNAATVDATGKYLMPGLWDMHAHVLWPGLDTFFPLMIANGVTGVRDMGTHFPAPVVNRWRADVESAKRVGPRFVWAGPVLDGPQPVWPGSTAISNPDQARDAVRFRKQNGYDFVKVYQFVSRPAYDAIADEARRQGIPFVGHLPNGMTTAECAAAGQHSIEHLMGLREECRAADGRSWDPVKMNDLFTLFKKRDVYHCPTLYVSRLAALYDQDDVEGYPVRKYLPKAIRDKVHLRVNPDKARNQRRLAENLDLTKRLHDAGVPLLAGTDSPMGVGPPGFALHEELELMVTAGLTPAEALRTATVNPARFLHREKDLGSIEPGKLADLVLLDADPLRDIRNVTRISTVVADGRVFDRAALRQLAADLRAAADANKLDERTADELLKEVTGKAP